jgi:hypothetical protein
MGGVSIERGGRLRDQPLWPMRTLKNGSEGKPDTASR